MSPLSRAVAKIKDALVILSQKDPGEGLENQIVKAIHDQVGAGMGLPDEEGSRFSAYSPLRGYCRDLMMPYEPKSVEPLAAPARVASPASTAAGFRGAVGVRHHLLHCSHHEPSADRTLHRHGRWQRCPRLWRNRHRRSLPDQHLRCGRPLGPCGLPALTRRLGACMRWRT